ncbi:hypothetical protein H4582DRAFT_1296207 [Lactarius indigo]|nr:hypothetical protein H4582DRAFT_1296207 [Lactarius indigo]
MSAGAGSQQTTGECYNCGQPGHWASACPAGNQRNNLKRSKTTIPSKSRGTGPAGAGGAECFKCGKEGHYSKVVGQAAKRPPRAGRPEDGAEVGRRLCPNPEARRGHSEQQTTIGTDGSSDTLLIIISSYPGCNK